MDQHAWPWLIYSELQFPLTLSLTLQNSSFYCKGFHRISVYEGSHSINPLYFLIIKPTWHSFKPFHPATPRAPLLVFRARGWVASLPFSAAPHSALRHGAQIDDTGCLEISAPPAGLQLQTANNIWACFASVKVLLDPEQSVRVSEWC